MPETQRFADFVAHNRTRFAAAAGLVAAVVLFTGVLFGSRDELPDFGRFEAGPERKEEFFTYVAPLIEAENQALLEDRQRLLELADALRDSDELGRFERRRLRALARQYQVALETEDGDPRSDGEIIDALLPRVDAVPTSLALAQAAKESGWGTSRFAREGNNLFGQWCFEAGCGIVPESRGAGKSHEVQAFDSPAESVASYMRNMNTNAAYKSFRERRKQQRETGGKLSGVALAEGLGAYSERRGAYVAELKQLIIGNDLEERMLAGDAGQSGGSRQ